MARIVATTSIATLVLPGLSVSQQGLTTFFGPEVFTRETGEPFKELREFSTDGFEAPFVLHLQNGIEKEEERVSSAKIWLNDEMIFRPSVALMQPAI